MNILFGRYYFLVRHDNFAKILTSMSYFRPEEAKSMEKITLEKNENDYFLYNWRIESPSELSYFSPYFKCGSWSFQIHLFLSKFQDKIAGNIFVENFDDKISKFEYEIQIFNKNSPNKDIILRKKKQLEHSNEKLEFASNRNYLDLLKHNSGFHEEENVLIIHLKVREAKKVETFDWLVDEELSDFHMTFEPFVLKNFSFTCILSNEDNLYSIQLCIFDIKGKSCFKYFFVIIHNVDPSKSIYLKIPLILVPGKETQKSQSTYLTTESFTEENGWIFDGGIHITIEKSKNARKYDSLVHESYELYNSKSNNSQFTTVKETQIQSNTLKTNLNEESRHNHLLEPEKIQIPNEQFKKNEKDNEIKKDNEIDKDNDIGKDIFFDDEFVNNIKNYPNPREKIVAEYHEFIITPKNHSYTVNLIINDFEKEFESSEYFAKNNKFSVQFLVNFKEGQIYVNYGNFGSSGAYLPFVVYFHNKNYNKSTKVEEKNCLVCSSASSYSIKLPYSYDDVINAECDWLIDGKIKITVEILKKSIANDSNDNVSLKVKNDLAHLVLKVPKTNILGFKCEKFELPSILLSTLQIHPLASIANIEELRSSKGNSTTNLRINFPIKTNEKIKLGIKPILFNSLIDQESISLPMQRYSKQNSNLVFDILFNPLQSGFLINDSYYKLHFLFFFKTTNAHNNNLRYANQINHDYLPRNYQKISYKPAYEPAMLPEKTEIVRTMKDENTSDSDSIIKNNKNKTEYVGLNNQGATCYMNSMLQALFHLPAFRHLVYEMPTTGNENSNDSIPLNLQRLFYKMQFGNKSCSTKALTKSFGWGSAETFMQHDIQEFSRVLLDNLMTKMKGTELENGIPNLFKGTYRNYIKCTGVPYQSNRVEEFYDLTMTVKGIPSLEESFKQYTSPEYLNGDNKYQTEEYGKQDAIMGVEFLEFPPVLFLHLSRFTFDYATERMIKVNDRFEFPPEIDLTPYMAEDAPGKSKSNLYDLYGVLVHSGGVFGGHYYAFLRTSTSTQWFKFNDSFVSKDSFQNAVLNNYGNTEETVSSNIQHKSSLITNTERDIIENNGIESQRRWVDIYENEYFTRNSHRSFDRNSETWEREQMETECRNLYERQMLDSQVREQIACCQERLVRRLDDQHHYRHINNHDRHNVYNHDFYHENNQENEERFHTSRTSNQIGFSGYMLIYVRREDASSIYEPIEDNEVPQHLKDYLKYLDETKRNQKTIDDKEKNTITIFCMHENILRTNSANRIRGFVPNNNRNELLSMKLDIQMPCNELYEKIAKQLNESDPSRIRLWRCDQHNNSPERIIPNSSNSNIAGIRQYKSSTMVVLVQSMNENETLDIEKKHMVFIKFFFPQYEASPLQYLGSAAVNSDDQIKSLCQFVYEKAGIPKDTKLDIYEENISSTMKKIKKSVKFCDAMITNGSILIFKAKCNNLPLPKDFNFEEPTFQNTNNLSTDSLNESDGLPSYKYSDLHKKEEKMSLEKFYQGPNEKIKLEVRNYQNALTPLFYIVIPLSLNLSKVKKFIAKLAKFEYDSDKDSMILFRKKNKAITKIDSSTLHKLKYHFNDSPTHENEFHVIYFYFLKDVKSIKSDHHLIEYKCTFSANAYSTDSKQLIFAQKNIKAKDLIQKALEIHNYLREESQNNHIIKTKAETETKTEKVTQAKEIPKRDNENSNAPIKINDGDKFRLISINLSMIISVYEDEDEFKSNEEFMILRIEKIPEVQKNIPFKSLMRIYYAYWDDGTIHPYGEPFLFHVIDGEQFSATKERLKYFMGLPEGADLLGYSFNLKLNGNIYDSNPPPVSDEQCLSELRNETSQLIIMPSIPPDYRSVSLKGPKKPNRDQSVKIYH
ncbi:hypothetical protein TRFO_15331 [Tritrichomonas foetus]|uniref:ubiquitinyl hydrolase 1 n=1 Tax=Tritrichomonas foetus TaxID=1144522 RepID=A0A1J4KSR8_9EUKA|nr:hypothetical protein TRFO_15331 [Tritrichomonas foetus]|eukprot:OHT14307.1 hypothetical protein TRFO_15331 [Tritrichomonas foetus]